MSIELVTGHAGSAHVTSAQDGRLNAAAWGTGKYVLPLQAQFAITVDSANQVTVATGDALLEGRHVTSEAPTALAVDSGTQGMKRNDLVAIVYSKNGSGVESAALQVVKGTETSGTPTDPAISSGSILAGDTSCAMALWRLPINGITLGEPEQLYSVADLLALSENYTYSLGYTDSTRTLKLTGDNGGASTQVVLPVASSSTFGLVQIGGGITNSSGNISVPLASTSVNGLMNKTMYDAMRKLPGSSGAMGFGYQNASGAWYFYFPVNAAGASTVTLARVDTWTVTVDGHVVTPSLGEISATLRNNGALLEISAPSGDGTATYSRKPCVVWCPHLGAVFS